MAKQIVESGFRLSMPSCRGLVSEQRYGNFHSESFCATNPGAVTLCHIAKECLFEETMVDICGEVNGFPLVIYFSYPGRSVSITLEEPRNTRCGILEIDLTSTRALFLKKKTTYERFADEIRAFIKDSDHAKKWIFHPRRAAAMSQVRTRLEEQMISWVPTQQQKHIRKNPYVRFERGGNQHYECVVCKTRWSGFENEKQLCPDCRTHFYVRQV